jgi:ABC-2 type transport system ATP-binding protein
VFFSSNVLSDAEALCSRVAILANGRLAAAGSLKDLGAFKMRSWELVVADARPELFDRAGASITRVTPIGDGRFSLELPLATAPEPLIAELVRTGARVISLNPLRETLEDVFIQQVQAAPRERGTEARVRT